MSEGARVVVFTGGRDYGVPKDKTEAEMERSRRQIAQFDMVLYSLSWDGPCFVGDCPTGLDDLVRERTNSPVVFEANWDNFGRSAGPLRNAMMIEDAIRKAKGPENVLLIAFPGGAGTRSCVGQALKKGVTVMRVE